MENVRGQSPPTGGGGARPPFPPKKMFDVRCSSSGVWCRKFFGAWRVFFDVSRLGVLSSLLEGGRRAVRRNVGACVRVCVCVRSVCAYVHVHVGVCV